MNPLFARAIAAVGVIFGVAGIWTSVFDTGYGSETYWNFPQHADGIAMLVLTLVAALGVVLAFLRGSPVFDRLWLLAGLTLGGFALFFPILIVSQMPASQLRAGAWLGGGSFVLFLVAGALLPYPRAGQD